MNAETTSTKGPLRVFVSYRREDSPGHAGRLYDTLTARLPQAELFMDVDNIEPGVDFVETINAAVGSCDVLLALIGPRWGSVTRNGSRRLEEPGDFVRLELEAALRRNVRVIPVLFRDATMPRHEDLPESIQALTRRNAIHIADDRWRSDADRLVAALEKMVPTTTNPPLADDAPKTTGPEGDGSRYRDSGSTRLSPAMMTDPAKGSREIGGGGTGWDQASGRQRRTTPPSAPGRHWPRVSIRGIIVAFVLGLALVGFGLGLGNWVILPLLR